MPFALLALVPLFGMAVHRPWPAATAGVAALAVAELVHWAAWGSRGGIAEVAASTGLAIVTVAVGSVVRERRRGAERERALLAGQAVAEERLRIARELHDAVGHDVSLMVVQAPAVGATTTDPRRARGRRTRFPTSVAGTMAEMHRTLRRPARRRRGPPRRSRASTRSTTSLDGARAAGVDVAHRDGGRARRPWRSTLSAYRIVQEAVTNVGRATPAAAQRRSRVRYGPDALELVVADEGAGHGGERRGRRRPRARRDARAGRPVRRGRSEAGPRDDRGFAVRAVLPYPDGAP